MRIALFLLLFGLSLCAKAQTGYTYYQVTVENKFKKCRLKTDDMLLYMSDNCYFFYGFNESGICNMYVYEFPTEGTAYKEIVADLKSSGYTYTGMQSTKSVLGGKDVAADAYFKSGYLAHIYLCDIYGLNNDFMTISFYQEL